MINEVFVVKRLDWSEQHRVVGEKPTLSGYEQGKIVNVLEEVNRIFYNFSLGIREGLRSLFLRSGLRCRETNVSSPICDSTLHFGAPVIVKSTFSTVLAELNIKLLFS